MLHAIKVDTQTLFLATGDRVKEPYALNEAAITRIALISHCDVVKRFLFCASASQSNCDHKLYFLS
jgi:hypothetical protein